jgi:hypothetical protein
MRTSLGRDVDTRYIAPGFALQFTTILLPLVFFLVYFRWLHSRRPSDRAFAVILFVGCAYLLSVSGVRSYLVYFACTFMLLASQSVGVFGGVAQAVRTRFHWIALGIAGAGFSVFTVLGRLGQGSSGGVLDAPKDFFDRLVFVSVDNQLLAMDVFQHQPLGWGAGWVLSLTNVLPRGGGREIVQDALGVTPQYQGDMSMVVYRMLFGGDGSAPLDMWSSIWLEFGWLGTALVPLVIGYSLQRMTIRFLRAERTIVNHVVFTMSAFALMNLFEPLALFLGGFGTLMVYLGLVRVVHWTEAQLRQGRPIGATSQ